MHNDSPLVSIGIPTYNSVCYLRSCLDSIVSQTYRNIEIIFSDNASTDGTACKLSVNEINIGAGANFNKLINMAQGEFIAIYHADDVYDKNIVEDCVRVLSKNATVGFVGTMGTIINSEGNLLRDIELHDEIKKMNKEFYAFDEAVLCALRNGFVTPSIMVRKKVYQEFGAFDQQKYKSACDYEMWLRIARRYKVAILDKKCISYRIHENQGSEMEVRKNVDVPDIIGVLKEYRNFMTDATYKRYCNSIIDKWLIKAAKKQNALGYYGKSNETLNFVESRRYRISGLIIRLLNAMQKSVKKRKYKHL
jgi:glycosyltransferase involved in cell wall biosynthesis